MLSIQKETGQLNKTESKQKHTHKTLPRKGHIGKAIQKHEAATNSHRFAIQTKHTDREREAAFIPL